MTEPLPSLLKNSIHIAADYLQRSGEFDNPEADCRRLMHWIAEMVRNGETRKMVLANKAIDQYRKFKAVDEYREFEPDRKRRLSSGRQGND
jgi:hypothetical protein